jgi:hypothetical protein
VDAREQVFAIWHRRQVLKQGDLKGLPKTLLPVDRCAPLMCQHALSVQRRLQHIQQKVTTLLEMNLVVMLSTNATAREACGVLSVP